MQLPETLPPKNHNNPPAELDILRDAIELRHIQIIQEADKHLKIAVRIPGEFGTEIEANYATDFIKIVQNCQKQLEKGREVEKAPYLRGGQFVDAFFKEIDRKLSGAIAQAKIPLDAWLRRKATIEAEERQREAARMRQAEISAMEQAQKVNPTMQPEEAREAVQHVQAVQEAAQVAQQAASAPISTMASSAGKISSGHLKKVWKGQISDPSKLDLEKLRPYMAMAALQVALNQYVKMGGRDLAGAVIKEEIETVVR